MGKHRHSLTTWRYLGRIGFHARPDHRCLPPENDPEALDAWCDGFRRAWWSWYAGLPTTELDKAALEHALTRALQGADNTGDAKGTFAADERQTRRMH